MARQQRSCQSACLAVCAGSNIAVSKKRGNDFYRLMSACTETILYKREATGCTTDELYLVLVIGRGCASFQVAHLTVLIGHNQRPLKLQHQSLHVKICTSR